LLAVVVSLACSFSSQADKSLLTGHHLPHSAGDGRPGGTFCGMDASLVVAIASVTVAIVAVVVTSIFNVLTLRRSSKTLELAEETNARTEQRYQADRHDARNERIRNALVDVMVAVTSFSLQSVWYTKLLADFANGEIAAGRAQSHDVERLRPAANEVFRTTQAALFLCDEGEITTIVKDIERQTFAAVDVVTSHEVSESGIVQAIEDLNRYRKAAGGKAAELLKVAHRLFDSPTPEPAGRNQTPTVRV
jgi:hypothetical protein